MQDSARQDDNTTGYAGRDEKLVKQLRCSKDWPVCLFDFTLGKSLHDFFVFKVRPPATIVASKGGADKERS